MRARLPADLVFANHVLLGGAGRRGHRRAVRASRRTAPSSSTRCAATTELPAWGREALAGAEAVFVGSQHIREVLEDVVGHVDRVHEVPPGVDVDEFRPRPRDEALAAPARGGPRDPPNPGNANERLPDEGNAERLAAFFADDEPTVVYFGKLLYNKGVHLLLEALRGLDARARDRRLRRLPRASSRRPRRRGTLFTGPLEHRHLVHLLPLADVAVVPSIFPEAFGMVAAEAAAAGSPPLVARHSGLAEVAEGLEAEYPPEHRHLASFANGDVADLRAKLAELLALPESERARSARRARACRRSAGAGRASPNGLLQPFN